MHASVQKHSAGDLPPPGLFVAPSTSAVADSAAPPKAKAGDLFSVHDFDIKIDLQVPLPSQPVVFTPKLVPSVKEAPRCSLNLQDYKKKRGLI